MKAHPEHMSLFEGSTDLVCRLDRQGLCLDLNSACEDLLGRPRDQLLNQSILSFLTEAQRDGLIDYLKRDDKGPLKNRDFAMLRSDGSTVHTQWSAHWNGDTLLAFIRDVSEQHEAALSRENLQNAVVEAVGGVCVVDNMAEDRPVIFINERFTEITGYAAQEVIGRNCRFLQGENRDQAATQVIREALQTGTPAKVTLRNYRKDGSLFWNELQITPVRGPQGEVTHYVGFQFDVTERYEALAALEKSQRLLQKTQEFGRIGGWEYSISQKRLLWSEEVFRIHQLPSDSPTPSLEEAISYYHEASAKVLDTAFSKCARSGEPFDLVLRLLDASQNERWVRIIGEPEGGDTPPLRVQGTIQDITDAVETSLALRGSEYRFRKAFKAAPHGMAILSVDGGFLNVNSNFCAMLGFQRDQLIERALCQLTVEDDLELCRNLLKRLLNGELPSLQLEIRLKHQEGHSVPVALSAALVNDINGEPEHLVAHIVDLTIQKRLEEEQRAHSARRRQAQKLESLGLLAGGIAHDFNNLLTSIMGNVELALMEMSAQGMARDCLRDVITTAQRAAELCNQMLAYAGKGKFLVQPTNLSELVWEMCRLLAPKIPGSVSTRYLLAENLPLIEADTTQIRQVVMNLLTNAIEAIEHRGGSITISTEAKYCDRDILENYPSSENLEPGSYVIFQITDTGSGMCQDTLSKIFDPFYTTKFTGRGLGLAAVLGIVKAHQGAISVSSELGTGTTVTVLLPAQGVPNPSSNEETIKAEDERIILIVDDDKRVLKVGERILSMAGYTVLRAEDGRMGLHVFRQRLEDIDAVLLDMTMPHLSGEEVFKAMNELRPGIPVLLTSGYTSGDTLGSFSGENKPAGFIQKPYRPYELLKKIEDLIGVHPKGRKSSELRTQ